MAESTPRKSLMPFEKGSDRAREAGRQGAMATARMQAFKKILTKVLDSKVKNPEEYGIITDDPAFIEAGLTHREVIVYHLVNQACHGDKMAIREIFDREMGKPVQPTENKNVEMSYMDFLMDLAAQEEAETGTMSDEARQLAEDLGI